MRRLVPYLSPLVAFFVAAALATPGFAVSSSTHRAHALTVCPPGACPGPLPICEPAQCPAFADDYTAFLDEPLASANDALDDQAIAWSSCAIDSGLISAFVVADPTVETVPASSGVDVAGCLAKRGRGSGTTIYRHYGPPADLPGAAATYSGNYGHKYDHEMYMGKCAADCSETLYLANKTGSRTWAWQYCLYRNGYCPNVSFSNVQRAKPYCSLDTAYTSKARFECWYVY